MRYVAFPACFAILWLAACGAPAAPPQPAATLATAGSIAISEPRLRLPAAGRDQTAGYLTMTNTGRQNDSLIGASSPRAGAIELHAHIETADGLKSMRRINAIEIPAGKAILLSPGGLHLMIKDAAQDLKLGENVPISLTFESGARTTLDFPIVANPRADASPDDTTKEGHVH